MIVLILLIVQTVASAGLILVGSLVEAYGYGLSLGTKWPYHEKILALAMRGDPEAWHRIIASTLGVLAVVLVILVHDANTIAGLVLIALTALLGMATLYVLSGKAPAFLHGLHGLLAYSTFLSYLSELVHSSPAVWSMVNETVPLHALLLMIFLGGMVTGQRGYQRAIGEFVVPRSKGQWVFVLHGLVWLLLVLTLAYYVRSYSAALVLALFQGVFGFMLYQAVNARPSKPGILTVFHQSMAMLICLAMVFQWHVGVPFMQ
jgi:hypothetical protein